MRKSNGTTQGTTPLQDTNPGPGGTSFGVNAILDNGTIVFNQDDHQANVAASLWRTDGTAGGTQLLFTFSNSSLAPADFTMAALGNTAYFSAVYGPYGYELWKTDGTSAGTALVRDINTH